MLKLAIFKIDCTPPLKMPVGLNLHSQAQYIRDPLFMRGCIFDDGRKRVVIASMDYAALLHSAYENLRSALALATRTQAENVVIHCVHQHDAPLMDFEAAEYFPQFNRQYFSWWDEIIKSVSTAASAALDNFQEISAVGHAQHPVAKYASNRRVTMPDGQIRARLSRCGENDLRDAPEGIIDPLLRTICFKGLDDQIITSLSFYATHPQVASTGDKFSADAPGEAMRLVELGEQNSMPIFFTGAGGNITAGKYASNDLENNIQIFGKRLADAIEHNLQNLTWEQITEFSWQKQTFKFPVKEISLDKLLEQLVIPRESLTAAALLGAMQFNPEPDYEIFLLTFGSTSMLFLPGEPFVEYQLYVNSIHPDKFIAVAANCRDDFFYLPLAASFAEKGGYETENFCRTDERFESLFKTAIDELFSKATILTTK